MRIRVRIEKRKIFLIGGLVLAIAAMAMLNVLINKKREAIRKEERERMEARQANLEAVMVASKDIPENVVLETDSLDVSMIPREYVQPGTVKSLDRVAGMLTVAPIKKGEQITLSKLKQIQETGRGSTLAAITPVGKRAITVAVDRIAGLGGLIKAGDYVDVIATISLPGITPEGKQVSQSAVLPLFQNVLVLAVGRDLGLSRPAEGRYAQEQKEQTVQQDKTILVSLALSPKEANLLAFVQGQGQVRFMLRHPSDAEIEQLPMANWTALFPEMYGPTPEPEDKKPPPEIEYVEIYRGHEKDKIPLSK